jgi:hypothetical protein
MLINLKLGWKLKCNNDSNLVLKTKKKKFQKIEIKYFNNWATLKDRNKKVFNMI